MSFASPLLLLCLLALPAVAALLVWLDRRRRRGASAWASPALLPNSVQTPPQVRRILPVALLLVGAGLFLVGFARPQATLTVGRQEATLVIVLDVSGSMAANDVPPSRLAAAKAQIRTLLAATPAGYRAALYAFSDHTSLVVPPTADRQMFLSVLDGVRAGPQGTSLAVAVTRSVQLASTLAPVQGKRPPATVVVFSDGGQTVGQTTPKQAGDYARKESVPVSAVAVGTPNGVVRQQLAGGYTEQFQVPVQPQSLQQLVSASGGRLFTSIDPVAAKRVVQELGSRIGHRRTMVDVAAAAAAGGLVFMLAGGLLSGAWLRRIL